MTDFTAIHRAADAAGKAAAESVAIDPMYVTDGRQTWRIAGGVCGFAWVAFKGNTAWGRWAKARGLARKGYPSGLQIWVSAYGQSLGMKEAYAAAYAQTLREHGIADAYAGSRMD